jgi:hypothetical protein
MHINNSDDKYKHKTIVYEDAETVVVSSKSLKSGDIAQHEQAIAAHEQEYRKARDAARNRALETDKNLKESRTSITAGRVFVFKAPAPADKNDSNQNEAA